MGKKKNRRTLMVLLKALFIPVLIGSVLGFVFVVVLMQLEPRFTADGAADAPSAAPALPERVVILLQDRDETIMGMWQWQPEPNESACIPSLDALIYPQGKTLGELLSLARSSGDDKWVANHAQHLPTDCDPTFFGKQAQVVLLAHDGFVSLVDAYGGIWVGDERISGEQAWDYVSALSDSIDRSQELQRVVWLALADKARQGVSVASVQQNTGWFQVFPATDRALNVLEVALRNTPNQVATP